MNGFPLVIAHRGASGLAPENTALAVARAIALGADMVEVDVRLTRDGHPVILHDPVIGRTVRWPTGSAGARPVRRRIANLTLAHIRRMDAGSWWSHACAGLPVPTLDDVLDQCAGRIAVNLDVKGGRDMRAAARRRLVAHLERALLARHAKDWVLISSEDLRLLSLVRTAMPAAWLGVLVGPASRLPQAVRAARRLKAWSLHLPLALINPELVRSVHAEGLRLLVYTVNRTPSLRRLIRLGADGVFTDWPDRLLAARGVPLAKPISKPARDRQ
ncbi:MAG: glycerophosphodiester phosphodiesterase family protein [Nitrospirota bacterium]